MPALNDSIQNAFQLAFNDEIKELTAQTQARLRRIVDMVPLDGEAEFFDRIGSIEAQEINERHANVIPADLTFDRRKMIPQEIGVPLYVDYKDEEKMMRQVRSVYARRAYQALERKFDKMVAVGALASVLTGKDGTTTLSAASDGVIQVDATAGLTYAKLLEIESNFQKQEVGTELPIQKFLCISEQEHSALMQQGTLISGDFSRQYVVDKGQMVRALDFELIVFGSGVNIPILNVTGGVRSCLAIAKDGVKVGISRNWKFEWDNLPGKWSTTQLKASGAIGVLRMEGNRVQEVRTTAT